MVVPTARLAEFLSGHPHHLILENTTTILERIESEHLFIDRPRAEVSPEFRQIIPYVVVRHGEDFFLLTRLAKQNEARLHHKMSLGVGGHINPGHDLLAGMRKELEEEISVDGYAVTFLGILNDESTDVGRVHLGAVYDLRSTSRDVHVLETEKMTGAWTARRDLGQYRARMETWSQIVYDQWIQRMKDEG